MKLVTHTPLKPLDLSRGPHAGHSPTRLSKSDLGGVLSHSKRAGAASGGADRHAELVEQTKRWVAQTFFGTLMKQMHESPFKSKLFDGGRGGEAFTQMYDQRLTEHMGRGAGNKLVNAIVRKLEARRAQSAGNARAAYEKQGATTRVAPVSGAAAGNVARDATRDSGSGGDNPPGFGNRHRPKAPPAGLHEIPFANVRAHVETGR